MGTFTHKSYETKYTNNEKLSNIHELMQKMVRSKQLLHKTMANKDSKDKVNQYSPRFLDTFSQNEMMTYFCASFAHFLFIFSFFFRQMTK